MDKLEPPMTVYIECVANDVVPDLRTPSEVDLRDLVRARALAATIYLYHPVNDGEFQKEPRTWIARFMGDDADTQWSIVSVTSRLTQKEIGTLQPAALLKACCECVDFLRCIYGDQSLTRIIAEEMRLIFPALDEVIA